MVLLGFATDGAAGVHFSQPPLAAAWTFVC
jgi:hypothetical protein